MNLSRECRRLRETGVPERYMARRASERECEEFESHYLLCDACQRDIRLAAAVQGALADLGGGSREGDGSPGAAGWRKFLPAGVGLALAAGLAALLLLPAGMGVDDEFAAGSWFQPSELTVRTGSGAMAAALGTSWEDPGWSGVRGAADLLDARERAFRIGVRLADLGAARATADTAAAARAGARIERLAAGIQGGGLLVVALGEGTWEDLTVTARSIVIHPALLDLGVWTEGARLAFLAGRGELVLSGRSRDELAPVTAALERAAPPAPGRERRLVDRVRDLDSLIEDQADEDGELTEVRARVEEIATEAGG